MTMRSNRLYASGPAVLAVLTFAGAAVTGDAQTPRAPKGPVAPPNSVPATPSTHSAPTPSSAIKGADIAHFATRIGSFKLTGNDKTPPQGTLDMSFNGTVLISGPEKGTTIETKGNVRMEKETPDHEKRVYFGTGGIVVKGKVHALQFFGKDLTGTFTGIGIFRPYGEFDKKLETGFFWFEGGERRAWGTGGNLFVVPNQSATAPRARVKLNSGG